MCSPDVIKREFESERGFCLLKGIAEGTYNSKHAEAARLYYTTTTQPAEPSASRELNFTTCTTAATKMIKFPS